MRCNPHRHTVRVAARNFERLATKFVAVFYLFYASIREHSAFILPC